MLFSLPFDFILPYPVDSYFQSSTNIALEEAVDSRLIADDILQAIQELKENESAMDSYLTGPDDHLAKTMIKFYAWMLKGVSDIRNIRRCWESQLGQALVDEHFPTNCRDLFTPLFIVTGIFNSTRDDLGDILRSCALSGKVVSTETRIWCLKTILQSIAQYICRAYLPNTSIHMNTMKYLGSLVLAVKRVSSGAELGPWSALMLTSFGKNDPTFPALESNFPSTKERLLWIFLGARGWTPWCRHYNLETDAPCRLAFGKKSSREKGYIKGVIATLSELDKVWLIEQLVRRAGVRMVVVHFSALLSRNNLLVDATISTRA